MYKNTGIGQYVPGDSAIHRLDPRSKLISTLVMVMACVAASFPFPLWLVLLAVLIELFLTRINIGYYLKTGRPLFYLVLITAFLQIAWGVDIKKAFVFLLRLTGVIIVMQILMATTSPMALLGGWERMLRPFSRLKLPIPELIMIMTIALRFIPLYMEEWERIKKAQMSRGVNFADKNLIKRVKNFTALLVPLFRTSFQRADDLVLAMETRCYQGGQRRTCLYDFKMGRNDFVYIAITGGIGLIGIYL